MSNPDSERYPDARKYVQGLIKDCCPGATTEESYDGREDSEAAQIVPPR